MAGASYVRNRKLWRCNVLTPSVSVTWAICFVVLVCAVSSDSVLKAIDDDNVGLAWTKASGDGDLFLTHGTCSDSPSFITFEAQNEFLATLNRGVVPGEGKDNIPGSIRLRTDEATGFSDLEGFVRGEWQSLSQPSVKDVPPAFTTTACDQSNEDGRQCVDDLISFEEDVVIYFPPGSDGEPVADPFVFIGGHTEIIYYQCNGNDCGRPDPADVRVVAGDVVGAPTVVHRPTAMNPNAALLLGLRRDVDQTDFAYNLALVEFADLTSTAASCVGGCGVPVTTTGDADINDLQVVNANVTATSYYPYNYYNDTKEYNTAAYYTAFEPDMVNIAGEIHVVYYSALNFTHNYFFCDVLLDCTGPIPLYFDYVGDDHEPYIYRFRRGMGLSDPYRIDIPFSGGQTRRAGKSRLVASATNSTEFFYAFTPDFASRNISNEGGDIVLFACSQVTAGFDYVCGDPQTLNVHQFDVEHSYGNIGLELTYANQYDPYENELAASLNLLPDIAFDFEHDSATGELFWVTGTVSDGLYTFTCADPYACNTENQRKLVGLADVHQSTNLQLNFGAVEVVPIPGDGYLVVPSLGLFAQQLLDEYMQDGGFQNSGIQNITMFFQNYYNVTEHLDPFGSNAGHANYEYETSFAIRCNDTLCSNPWVTRLSPYLNPHKQGLIAAAPDTRTQEIIFVSVPTYGPFEIAAAQVFQHYTMAAPRVPCDLANSGKLVVADGTAYLCTLVADGNPVDTDPVPGVDLFAWVALGQDLRNEITMPNFRYNADGLPSNVYEGHLQYT